MEPKSDSGTEVSPKTPVFYDPHGCRWRRVRRAYLALAIVVTLLTGIFIASVLSHPSLPRLTLSSRKSSHSLTNQPAGGYRHQIQQTR